MSCLSLLLALSLHIGLEGNYNNVHPHARCDLDNTITGAYYNSEENVSFYLGKKYLIDSAELEVGLVTGYSGADIAPMIRIKQDNWFLAPAYETSGNVGIVFGYEFQLD